MAHETVRLDIKHLLESLTEEERVLLRQILEIEKSKLHLKNPRNIMEDLERAVREVIK
jgi:hypothetical protein